MRIFFDHLPKTAGTSMQHFFVQAVGQENVTNIIKNMKPATALATYAGKAVITGHFSFLPGDALPPGFVSATVLRDPRERALSMFFFTKNDVPESALNSAEKKIKSMTLDEALWDDFFVRQIANTQSTHFASFFCPHPETLPPDELFDFAARGLRQYDVIGTTERLDEYVELLTTCALGVPAGGPPKRMNVTSGRSTYGELAPRLRQRLEELTQVDQRLWALAGEIFESQRKRPLQIGPSSNDSPVVADGPDRNVDRPRPKSANVSDPAFELIEARLIGKLRPSSDFVSGELADLHIAFRCNEDIGDLTLGYSIHHDSGLHLFGVNSRLLGRRLEVGKGGPYHVTFSFPVNLGVGVYHVGLAAHTGLSHLDRCFLLVDRALTFNVVGHLDVVFEGLVNLVPSLGIGKSGADGQSRLEVADDTPETKVVGRRTPRIADPKGGITILAPIATAAPGSQLTVPVAIANLSELPWISSGTHPVLISYHWLLPDGTRHIGDGLRTPLPQGMLSPGTTANGTAFVEVPADEGSYLLQLSLVQEGECWFEERGFEAATVPVTVA